MIDTKKPKFNMALYIATLFIIIALIVIVFIMYKYSVEGENIPPFKISEMIVISGAKTEDMQKNDNQYSAKVIQNNDIKIYIEKNPKYKKDAIIKKIVINNVQIDKKQSLGNIEIYRPSKSEKPYEYKEEYILQNRFEYVGAQETYLKNDVLQIGNQGGIIEFSVILNELGTIIYDENEPIKLDGTLLNKLQLSNEQIEFQIKFDLVIELDNDIKLKTKITLDLPTGDILQNGIETIEQTDMKTVFKRI